MAAIEREIEIMKPKVRRGRMLWGMVIFLVVIGVGAVVRRIAHLVPILIHGYSPPTPASNPMAAQFAALDDVFARYPVLTLIHILPALIFFLLAPVQFSQSFREGHLQ